MAILYLFVKCIDVLIEVHIILIILHRLVLKQTSFIAHRSEFLGSIFVYCCTIIAHSKLVLIIIRSLFTLFNHAFIKTISRWFSTSFCLKVSGFRGLLNQLALVDHELCTIASLMGTV